MKKICTAAVFVIFLGTSAVTGCATKTNSSIALELQLKALTEDVSAGRIKRSEYFRKQGLLWLESSQDPLTRLYASYMNDMKKAAIEVEEFRQPEAYFQESANLTNARITLLLAEAKELQNQNDLRDFLIGLSTGINRGVANINVYRPPVRTTVNCTSTTFGNVTTSSCR